MTKSALSRTDLFGITASTICAIHCMATPIALALLPAYAGEAWESPLTHQLCAVAVTLFCLLAAVQGFRKHSDWKPLTPLAIGLLLVLAATFLLPESLHELYETPVLCFGSFALVLGHVWNIRTLCCTNCRTVAEAVPVVTAPLD
jgi:hypothetical protein